MVSGKPEVAVVNVGAVNNGSMIVSNGGGIDSPAASRSLTPFVMPSSVSSNGRA